MGPRLLLTSHESDSVRGASDLLTPARTYGASIIHNPTDRKESHRSYVLGKLAGEQNGKALEETEGLRAAARRKAGTHSFVLYCPGSEYRRLTLTHHT